MAFDKKVWVDRQTEFPGRRKLTAAGEPDTYDVIRAEGTIIADGDPLNAKTFNELEGRIATAFEGVEAGETVKLTYSKSSTTHALTGLNGRVGLISAVFTATANFNAGDTVTVDGASYAIQLSNGEKAEANLFVSGSSVSIILDTAGKKVNFKSAGGKKLPAGTFEFPHFKANGTFTAPYTGNYGVTVIGKGGKGQPPYGDHGGEGGASGGAAYKKIRLEKGQTVPVTIGTQSSFGNILSATNAGEDRYSVGHGTGGSANVDGEIGGDYNYANNGGFGAGFVSTKYYRLSDPPLNLSKVKSINKLPIYGGEPTDGKNPNATLNVGPYPYGAGGGGMDRYAAGNAPSGSPGAVIIEFISEG